MEGLTGCGQLGVASPTGVNVMREAGIFPTWPDHRKRDAQLLISHPLLISASDGDLEEPLVVLSANQRKILFA